MSSVQFIDIGNHFFILWRQKLIIYNYPGIGIGIILSDLDSNQENITCVVLQGMAAGTLLYVVFFEVLSRERDNRHSGIWQLLAILAGFLVMFALQVLSKFFVKHVSRPEQAKGELQVLK